MRSYVIFKRLARDTRGASAVEYGMILSLIVIGLVGAIAGVADETQKMWTDVATKAARAHGNGS